MVKDKLDMDQTPGPLPAPDTPPEPLPEPENLRFLRRLVTGLTAVMILGLLAIFTLLVIRLSPSSGPAPAPLAIPDTISLPADATAQAFTRGRDWVAIVTDDDRILIFDAATGALRQTVTIENSD